MLDVSLRRMASTDGGAAPKSSRGVFDISAIFGV
jgi:hypothetical protein